MSHVISGAKALFIVAALVGAFAHPAHAQNTGVIEGTITDEQGEPVARVKKLLSIRRKDASRSKG